ncbi:MAG: DinB family protein [Planctomycetota bacterium]
MVKGIEANDPAAYRLRMLKFLGDREPLEVFAETAERLRELFAGKSDAVVRTRPFAGKWTPLEVLGHLVDAEWCLGWRFRLILAVDRPRLEPIDQERWIEAQAVNEQDATQLLADFEVLRDVNLRLLRRLSVAQRRRVGVHADRGEESIDTILTLYAGHDLAHLDQIARYLEAIG